MFSPLRGSGIDYARVPTTSGGVAVALDAISRVLAVLGQFSEREQQVLVGWAMGLGYREIARQAAAANLRGLSVSSCKRLHQRTWPQLHTRLEAIGLVGD